MPPEITLITFILLGSLIAIMIGEIIRFNRFKRMIKKEFKWGRESILPISKGEEKMGKERYECWAGLSHEKYLDVMISILERHDPKKVLDEVEEMRFETIWPIVDRETCGEIKGFPRPNQIYCFSFDSNAQAKVAKALNLHDQMIEMSRAKKERPK